MSTPKVFTRYMARAADDSHFNGKGMIGVLFSSFLERISVFVGRVVATWLFVFSCFHTPLHIKKLIPKKVTKFMNKKAFESRDVGVVTNFLVIIRGF